MVKIVIEFCNREIDRASVVIYYSFTSRMLFQFWRLKYALREIL